MGEKSFILNPFTTILQEYFKHNNINIINRNYYG